jgi:hypothetical protein
MLRVVSACSNRVEVGLNGFSVGFDGLREFTCTRKQYRFCSTSMTLTSDPSVTRSVPVTLNAPSGLISW